MNITILGCGYVGKALATHWRAAGHHITATTRSVKRVAELQEYADRVVLLHINDLYNILEDSQVLLLSMAADHPSDYESTYLNTAQALLKILPQLPLLKQIIYTSSTSVYGDHQGQWVEELSQLKSIDHNSRILIETEKELLQASQLGCSTCIMRLGGIYGPGRELNRRLKNLNGCPLAGSGEEFTNLIHIEDIIGGIDFALYNRLEGIYNLCNDSHLTRRDLYDTLCQQENLAPLTWDPSLKSLHTGNKRVSNTKIKAAGYEFIEPLIEIT